MPLPVSGPLYDNLISSIPDKSSLASAVNVTDSPTAISVVDILNPCNTGGVLSGFGSSITISSAALANKGEQTRVNIIIRMVNLSNILLLCFIFSSLFLNIICFTSLNLILYHVVYRSFINFIIINRRYGSLEKRLQK